MDSRHRILLVDDDAALLEMYREILGQLPSRPEVLTATSGARGMEMLDSEPFDLLICDLKMPKMDGLQVLSIVRRKYPSLRTVVLTSVEDEQFRSRVYALGVDLFWQKPGTAEEINRFQECIESLLGQEVGAGFRGMQSKSLVDLIQLECLSHSSSVLTITSGPLRGRIWITDGDLIDAETDSAKGEDAFRAILAWKAGNFETIAAEPDRPRTIFKSYNALLLESAQTLDESRSDGGRETGSAGLSALTQVEGVEFLLHHDPATKGNLEARGLESPGRMAEWAHQALRDFKGLGDKLQAGPLELVECRGPQRHVALTEQGGLEYCAGWQYTLSSDEVRTRMKKLIALWVS